MKTIIEQPGFIVAALGKQAVVETEKYRPIKYLIFSECPRGILVYNTLTKELILTDSNECAVLKSGKDIDISENKRLIEQYFLVTQDFNERECCDQLKNLFKLLDNDDSITSYVIFTTSDCNARCFYCFERGQAKISLTSEKAIDVAKYIVKNAKNKKVAITWFGGEPLYNIEPINLISDYLEKSGIKFGANMVTNAYLFDEKIIETAKEKWNLKSVQITLDGTEEIYNKTKNYIYKNEISPFLRVINNIKLLSEAQINVIIRINMDLFNKDNLYRLIDYLYERFSGNEYVSVYVRTLFDNTGKLQTERSDEDRKKLYDDLAKLQDYLSEKNMYHFQNLRSVYKLNNCIGSSKHGVVIMPDGKLGMCNNHIDKYIYGDIYNGITDAKVIDDFLVYKKPVANCDNCPLYPNCARLEKCPYYTRDCEDYERNILISDLQKFMLNTFYSKNKVEN